MPVVFRFDPMSLHRTWSRGCRHSGAHLAAWRK